MDILTTNHNEPCKSLKEAKRRLDNKEIEIRELEGKFSALDKAQLGLMKEVDYLTRMVEEIREDVKELKSKPSKRWDIIWSTGIAATVSTLIGILFTKLG